jgi:hypothetical protein
MVYKYARGLPTRGVASDIASLVFYTSDPGEAAYYSARTLIYDWMDKNNIESSGGSPTSKSNALYYWRQAKKFGDDKAAARWMGRWEELSKDMSVKDRKVALKQSIKAQRPLFALPTKHRGQFLDGLTPEEQVIFQKADEWWAATYLND